MHQHSSPAAKKPLNVVDIIAALILFALMTCFLWACLERAVPGLLKEETLAQIRWSGGLFILFWALAGNFLIKPYIDLALEREEKTSGSLSLAAEKIRQSRDILQHVEAQLREVRLIAGRKRDTAVEEAKREVQKLIDAAQSMAAEHRKKAQDHIVLLKEEARREVSAEAQKLASLVVKRVLAPGVAKHDIH